MRVLALLCGLLIAAAVPATGAAPPSGAVSRGTLPGGGSFIVRSQHSIPVAVVELWFRAPSVGFARDPIPGLSLLAAKAVAASVPITGTTLSRAVTDMGGRLTISGYFTPVLTAAGLRTSRAEVIRESLIRSFDSDEVLRDALLEELFTSGPAHYSVYGKPEDLGNVSIETLTDFATRAFRAKNAYLIVTGAVDPQV